MSFVKKKRLRKHWLSDKAVNIIPKLLENTSFDIKIIRDRADIISRGYDNNVYFDFDINDSLEDVIGQSERDVEYCIDNSTEKITEEYRTLSNLLKA